jgi:3-deoxy-manno-octulosonate cytidylyltransferase (CMP-KDO synthetase)
MSLTDFKVVIPARYGSSRLPGKPLLDIAGKPMIVHACERAQEAQAGEIIVATDDARIFDAVAELGISVLMTSADHQSGTERINEVAQKMDWPDDAIVVNLQGDEPRLSPLLIQQVAEALAGQSKARIATLAARITEPSEVLNPNAVKVVLDQQGYALYFSRAPIPWDRNRFSHGSIEDLNADQPYWRHIGIYAYTPGFLKQYCAWPSSQLESVECLEQLRILWQGEPVFVKTTDKIPEAGVDTIEDLERVRNAWKS